MAFQQLVGLRSEDPDIDRLCVERDVAQLTLAGVVVPQSGVVQDGHVRDGGVPATAKRLGGRTRAAAARRGQGGGEAAGSGPTMGISARRRIGRARPRRKVLVQRNRALSVWVTVRGSASGGVRPTRVWSASIAQHRLLADL